MSLKDDYKAKYGKDYNASTAIGKIQAVKVVDIEMEFSSDLVKKLNCAIPDCELSDFVLNYRMNLADEWVKGSGNCPKSFCNLSEVDHFVKVH